MRHEARMKGNEFQTQLFAQRRRGQDVAPVLIPRRVGRDAAREPDRVKRTIIFADTPKHPGNNVNITLAEELGGLSPDLGSIAQRVERQLNSPKFGFIQLVHEVLRALRLQRPGAYGQSTE